MHALAAFEDLSMLEVVDRAAGSAQVVVGVGQVVVLAGDVNPDLGLDGIVDDVLERDLPTVEVAVVLEDLDALDACAVVTDDRVRLVGLDEHVDLDRGR